MAWFRRRKSEQQDDPTVSTPSLFGIEEWIRQNKPSLLPRLDKVQVLEFEQANGVELPTDYRTFITTVCDGGAFGPEYGLLPLGAVPKHNACHEGSLSGHRAARPFPFTEEWVWEDEEQTDDRDRRIEETTHGTLVLGEEGCGAYWALIVTGPCRGEVWLLTGEGITPCRPRMGFGQWLETLACGGLSWWAPFVMHWGPREGTWREARAAGSHSRTRSAGTASSSSERAPRF
ncbi:SMI1/KNR4 family protein [Gemmatimonadota bacterium]